VKKIEHWNSFGTSDKFWDVDAGHGQLGAHLAPDRGILALGGGHEAANLDCRRLVDEKSPDRRAELLLLVGKGELDAPFGHDFDLL
jgi:hypothetical protein